MSKEQKRLSVDTGIATSDRDLSLKKAEIKREVDVANALAQKAGEMELKVQDIRIAEKEVDRQKLELNATVRESADAKKYEAERLADAERYRVERQAAADRKRREQAAAAVKAEGLAQAEAESTMRRDIGLAEAEAIQAKGEAEAEARRESPRPRPSRPRARPRPRRGACWPRRSSSTTRPACRSRRSRCCPRSPPPSPSRCPAPVGPRSSARAAPMEKVPGHRG